MLLSMTGYGKSSCTYKNKKINIEIKSLNSKNLDLSVRIPQLYKEKETALRSLINQKLQRGKIEVLAYTESQENDKDIQINPVVFDSYFKQLSKISETYNINNVEMLFQSVLRLPEILKTEHPEIDEEEYTFFVNTFNEAIENLNEFRKQEGAIMSNDISERVDKIHNLIPEIEKYEQERIETVKERINKNLQQAVKEENIDRNRFEQELIYYLEKYDITEEKVRLQNHCDYFIETIKEKESSGKKLGFISQEIGREINTLGSKSNHSEMQKIVVLMKDELEKIKEQTLNIL